MITPVSRKFAKKLEEKINAKTKPIGALGKLESIAKQIGCIQNTLTPKLTKPTIIVFAADHGVAINNPVSSYSQKVTQQMVLNFLNGGAAINIFCNQNDIILKIIDAGINGELPDNPFLFNCKIAYGTKDFTKEKALSANQYALALETGRRIVRQIHNEGTNVIGFGEMGIGNTSAAALLMSYFTNTPIEECVGSGTGLDENGIINKTKIIKKSYDLHIATIHSVEEALCCFGGFEIVMLCGAILEAANREMIILIDGFIVTAALLAAHTADKNVLGYCIFSHQSSEKGHKKMLSYLNVNPLLNIEMRLGEGSGCAIAYPIVDSAVNFLNEMATFESANVSKAT